MLKKLLPVLVLAAFSQTIDSELVQVELPNGLLEGKIQNNYYAFTGVPYAEPPIGDNRFEIPKQYTKVWTKPYKAHQFGSPCLQLDFFKPPQLETVFGDEDCLYLNVFTTSLNQSSQLPVFFFIHGGAFIFGHAMLYGEKSLLANRQGVLVSINYRLGPLGFLSTENSVVPGNMGLKDQQMALEWTYNNINKFGGDPNNIVMYGHSAGAASAHLHYLNAKSSQFISKAILLSGSALNSWAMMKNGLQRVQFISQHLQCARATVTDMVKCLKTVPGDVLVRSTNFFRPPPLLRYPIAPFGPTIEPTSDHAILTRTPIKIMTSAEVTDKPIVFSITSGEGYVITAELINTNLSLIDQAWNKIMPYILNYYDTVPAEKLDAVSQQIRLAYLGDKSLTRETIEAVTEIAGDRVFKYDIELAAKIHANHNRNNTYFMYYNYGSSESVGNLLCQCKNYKFSAVHTDDLLLIMNPLNIEPSSANDKAVGQQFVEMFYGFAKFNQLKMAGVVASPMACRNDHFDYLNITGPNDISIRQANDFGNLKLWKSLPYAEYFL